MQSSKIKGKTFCGLYPSLFSAKQKDNENGEALK